MSALHKLIEQERDARQFGFDWPDVQMILDQAVDECREIREVTEKGESRERLQEEIGDLLHAALSLCTFEGFDIDETLDLVNHKFGKRMRIMKELTKQHGLTDLNGQSIEFMLTLWKQAKKQ